MCTQFLWGEELDVGGTLIAADTWQGLEQDLDAWQTSFASEGWFWRLSFLETLGDGGTKTQLKATWENVFFF